MIYNINIFLQFKVPSDIEVSRSQRPKDVAALAEEIGILKSELELFGTRKAKVSLGVIDRLAGSKPGRYGSSKGTA